MRTHTLCENKTQRTLHTHTHMIPYNLMARNAIIIASITKRAAAAAAQRNVMIVYIYLRVSIMLL